MSGLTKEQLKHALIAHGVGLPSTSAKKGEYVRLYHKYVAPVANSKGDFSSDDDDFLPLNDIRTKTMADFTMVIDGVNVAEFDDEELYSRLKALGGTAGPVVETTRTVYQRQLFVLMGGELPDALVFNGDVDQDEYSDSDREVVEKPVPIRKSTRTESSKASYSTSSMSTSAFSSPQPSLVSDIRKRVLTTSGGDNRVVFDPDRHTPSPRPSLRTVTSTSSSSTTVRKFLDNGSSGVITMKDMPDAASKPGKMSLCLRLVVKLVLLALIMLLALYFYQNTPSESPFKAVEQLVQQALEAAEGGKAEEGDVAPATPQLPPPPTKEEVVFN